MWRIFQPHRPHDPLSASDGNGEQGPAAERPHQDPFEVTSPPIPRRVGHIDLFSLGEADEELRQLLAIQPEAIGMTAALALEAVLAGQLPSSFSKTPHACAAGACDTRQR